ncbi:MAG: transposase [Patescibacteria group bacterium]
MLRADPFVTGEYYHLYNRGIDKRVIFKLVRDYERFMMLIYLANSSNSFRLDELVNRQRQTFNEILLLDRGELLVSIGAWSLMTNHFHLIVRQEVDGGITKFMKKLGTGYSMFFNIKYQRRGALFGGVFKSKLIGVDDNYLRHLFGYLHLNPLDIRFPDWKDRVKYSVSEVDEMREFLESYRYSSYQDYIGIDRIEKTILSPANFPEYFKDSMEFKDFVEGYFTDIEVN